MLRLLKNDLIADVSRTSIDIRKKELDWFAQNFWLMATQATVIAGFSFKQLTTPPPSPAPFLFSLLHMLLTSLSFIIQLYVVCMGTFCCMWSNSTAIRGSEGFQSMEIAIQEMARRQNRIIIAFLSGLVAFFFSCGSMITMFAGKSFSVHSIEVGLLILTAILFLSAFRLLVKFRHHRQTSSVVQSIEQNFTDVGDVDCQTHVFPPEDDSD